MGFNMLWVHSQSLRSDVFDGRDEAVDPAQALGHDAHDLSGEERCLLHQKLEASLVDGDELAIAGGNNGCRARPGGGDAHFADDAAVQQGFDDTIVDDDFSAAGCQYVHHLTIVTLGKETATARDANNGRVVGEKFEKDHGEVDVVKGSLLLTRLPGQSRFSQMTARPWFCRLS